MRISKVAKRYAKGLLDFTQETGNTASVFAEMKDVVKILDASSELNKFFASPFIEAKRKLVSLNRFLHSFLKPAEILLH